MRIPRNEPLGPSDSVEATPAAPTAPERRCVLTGETDSRDTLLRLAISPDGLVLPDALARAPGRGAWIGVSRAELETAIGNGKLKGALARAFKGAKLEIPAELPAMAEQALIRALLDRLGLEMRAGRIILGSDRIAEQARLGRIVWLAHASDASDDGTRKLDQAYRVGREAEGSDLRGLRLPLDRTALSVALGRDNVVHLALADAASAKRVMVPLARLLHFTGAAQAAADDLSDRTAAVARQAAAID